MIGNKRYEVAWFYAKTAVRGLDCITLFPVLTLQKIFQKSVGIVLDAADNYGYSYGVGQQNTKRKQENAILKRNLNEVEIRRNL